MNYFFAIIVFFLFSSLGSFACAAAYRTIRDENWYGLERSHCDSCSHRLLPVELIPVISFIMLRGKCRYCGRNIDPLIFISETAAGISGLLFFARYGLSFALLFAAVSVIFLVFHSVTDFKTGYIYDSWALAFVLFGMALRIPGGKNASLDGIFGMAIGFCLIGIIILLSRGKMGWGDATLSAGIGAFAGAKLSVIALYCGFLWGGVFVLPMWVTHRINAKSQIALGPFLCIGCLTAMIAGESILYYFGFTASWPWRLY